MRRFARFGTICTFGTIWYNLKNIKNIDAGVFFLVKVILLHICVSRFLNCKNGTKSREVSQISVLKMSELKLYHWSVHKLPMDQLFWKISQKSQKDTRYRAVVLVKLHAENYWIKCYISNVLFNHNCQICSKNTGESLDQCRRV